jgi:CRP-like cAMP-binding protein
MSKELLEETGEIVEEISLVPGDNLFEPGDEDSYTALYILLKGNLKKIISYGNYNSGKGIEVTDLNSKFFGEIAFFTGLYEKGINY